MKNNKLLIGILIAIFILCGCGPSEIERKITSSSANTTITIATATTELTSTSSREEVSTSSVSATQMIADKKEERVFTSQTLPEEFIPPQTQKVVETSITQQEQNYKEQETTENSSIIIEEEYVVFKPSTHYIHRSSCHWVTDECVRIEDTKDIKARKCSECNPEMEIQNEYKEKKKKITPSDWTGPILTPSAGTVMGPSGKETYYNLDMSGVISIMRNLGYTTEKYPYWIREDGCKMFGDYIIVAADLNIRPRGTIVPTSLGMGIVCDTGGFAYNNSTQLDIATTW